MYSTQNHNHLQARIEAPDDSVIREAESQSLIREIDAAIGKLEQAKTAAEGERNDAARELIGGARFVLWAAMHDEDED